MNDFRIRFILILVLFITNLFSQNRERVIAKISDYTITDRDFKLRFELSPFVSKKSRWNEDTIKLDFLYSLVSEKLWFIEALNSGLDQSEDFKFYFKPLEDIFLRDALFKKEIESKIKLSANDITQGIYKAQHKLEVTIITSTDSAEIFKIYNHLEKNNSIDSVRNLLSSFYFVLKDYEIALGSLKDEEIEDLIYSLKPGEFTRPILSEVGWVIFYIKNILTTPLDITDEKIINEIKQRIKSRRALIKSNEYLEKILGGYTINIDEEAFQIVAQKIYERIILGTQNNPDSARAQYVLNDNDYRIIKLELGEKNLQKVLFKVFDKNVTIWDFLAEIAFQEPRFQSKFQSKIFNRLNKIAKNFVAMQILTYEARKQKLDQVKFVKDELARWKEHYLAQMLKLTYLDSARVSENEILDFYQNEYKKDTSILLINLCILTSRNIEEIESVLNQVNLGKTFLQFVKEYGKTDPLTDENGETGLKPISSLGDLGVIAAQLDTNQLYGPIKRFDGFSLIMVKEKKFAGDSIQIDYQNVKNYIKSYLMQKKFNNAVARKTLELVEKYQAKVYENEISNIKTTKIPMFVHRIMGFGGRIAGVPLLDNWMDYVDINQFRQKVLP